MIRLVKHPFLKKDRNDKLMDEFAEGMFPLRCIYIACEDDFEDLISNFQKNINSKDVFSLTLSKKRDVGFKNNLSDEDCLLAISKEGNDEFVRLMVAIAGLYDLKIMGVSADFNNAFEMISSNSLIIEENFRRNLERFLKRLRMKINGDLIECTPKGKLLLFKSEGIVVKISVNVGDEVKKGDKILVMKIQNKEINLESESDGVVSQILVGEGEEVFIGDPLIRIRELGEMSGECLKEFENG